MPRNLGACRKAFLQHCALLRGCFIPLPRRAHHQGTKACTPSREKKRILSIHQRLGARTNGTTHDAPHKVRALAVQHSAGQATGQPSCQGLRLAASCNHTRTCLRGLRGAACPPHEHRGTTSPTPSARKRTCEQRASVGRMPAKQAAGARLARPAACTRLLCGCSSGGGRYHQRRSQTRLLQKCGVKCTASGVALRRCRRAPRAGASGSR